MAEQMSFTDLQLKGGDRTILLLLQQLGPSPIPALRRALWFAPDDDVAARVHRLRHRGLVRVGGRPLLGQGLLAFDPGEIVYPTPAAIRPHPLELLEAKQRAARRRDHLHVAASLDELTLGDPVWAMACGLVGRPDDYSRCFAPGRRPIEFVGWRWSEFGTCPACREALGERA